MNKSVFNISKMDCAAEEQLIRMKLAGNPVIHRLNFDLAQRKLDIIHSGSVDLLVQALNDLRLGSSLQRSEMLTSNEYDNLDELTEDVPRDRRLLFTVLSINIFFFGLEVLTGILANSMGLMADALDMLADALVYGLALYAVGRVVSIQNKVALISGYLQLFLAAVGLVEVVRRFSVKEAVPNFELMLGVSLLALVGNSICLHLLRREKSEKVHLKASEIFTANDIIVNIGVMLAGGLVYFFHSPWPDLLIGLAVFIVVAQGSFRILNLARS